MQLTLVRDYSGTDCTLGILTLLDLTLQTLERPWVPAPPLLCGHPDTSCVPAGLYKLVRHDSPKHPQTWALSNPDLNLFPDVIPQGCAGRSEVLIHSANFVSQLEGCIAVGQHRSKLGDQWMVTYSRDALEQLKEILPWTDDHTLVIQDAAS